MVDSFDVAGFGEETNKSLFPFFFSHLLHFPSHPIPLPNVFCCHSYVIYSYFCPVCPHIFLVCHQLSYSSASSISMFLPHLTPVSAPCLRFSPITPTGPACLPTVGRGVSLLPAALGLWRPLMSTRQALAPRWWWSPGSSFPSQALHRDLLTSYRDR